MVLFAKSAFVAALAILPSLAIPILQGRGTVLTRREIAALPATPAYGSSAPLPAASPDLKAHSGGAAAAASSPTPVGSLDPKAQSAGALLTNLAPPPYSPQAGFVSGQAQPPNTPVSLTVASGDYSPLSRERRGDIAAALVGHSDLQAYVLTAHFRRHTVEAMLHAVRVDDTAGLITIVTQNRRLRRVPLDDTTKASISTLLGPNDPLTVYANGGVFSQVTQERIHAALALEKTSPANARVQLAKVLNFHQAVHAKKSTSTTGTAVKQAALVTSATAAGAAGSKLLPNAVHGSATGASTLPNAAPAAYGVAPPAYAQYPPATGASPLPVGPPPAYGAPSTPVAPGSHAAAPASSVPVAQTLHRREVELEGWGF